MEVLVEDRGRRGKASSKSLDVGFTWRLGTMRLAISLSCGRVMLSEFFYRGGNLLIDGTADAEADSQQQHFKPHMKGYVFFSGSGIGHFNGDETDGFE